LEDDDSDVRELAAESLGGIADATAVNNLISRLSDDSAFVRAVAAGALGRIGEPAAQSLLSQAQQSATPSSRDAARWALRFLECGPAGDIVRDGIVDADGVRNRLRTYLRTSSGSQEYSKLVAICDARLCFEKYTWPGFPFLGFPGKSAPQVSRMVIDETGR